MKATLWMTPRSPFARRIRLAAARAGLFLEERLVDTFAPSEDFLAANPLGMVPVLQWEGDAVALPDSNAILESIHELGGRGLKPGVIWPSDADYARAIRIRSAWCTGVMTAVVARFLELRGSSPSLEVVKDHEEVVARTLTVIEQDFVGASAGAAFGSLSSGSEDSLTQAGWDLIVLLEYLDLRFPEFQWREKSVKVREFFAKIQTRPLLDQTRPPL